MALPSNLIETESEWYPYTQRQIATVIGKKYPLLDSALLSLQSREIEAVFSIPKHKRKKFTAITKVHYNNACDELALFFIGAMTYFRVPEVSRYLSIDDFISGMRKFRNPHINLDIRKELKPDESFKMNMQLTETRSKDGILYAAVRVNGEYLHGRLIYCYARDSL